LRALDAIRGRNPTGFRVAGGFAPTTCSTRPGAKLLWIMRGFFIFLRTLKFDGGIFNFEQCGGTG
jgi:hypothetical protein